MDEEERAKRPQGTPEPPDADSGSEAQDTPRDPGDSPEAAAPQEPPEDDPKPRGDRPADNADTPRATEQPDEAEQPARPDRAKRADETAQAQNNVNQYFYGALDAPGAIFGIGTADSANARRRAVGRLDAGEADAILAPYVEPDCFEEAVRALQQDGVVVLVGPPGTGKRSAAVALVAKVAEGTEYVVLSPGRSLEDLAGGRPVFEKGVGYVLIDRMNEAAGGTADFDWRRVRDTVREQGAHLVVTTVYQGEGDAPGSVRHMPWQPPDLTAVLRLRLVRAGCGQDTVEKAASLMPAGCRIAEVAAAAARIADGADPAGVWQEYGAAAAQPVRDWFDKTRSPQEWTEVTALAFVTGLGYRDFETCQERLEEHVAATFPELANDEETAEATRRDADRRLSLSRNSLVAVEERKDGALTRSALVFPHSQYRRWVLEELWSKRSTAYWDGVRDWLTELVATQPGLGLQLSVASGLALLTRPAFDEVAENYLHPWAAGAAGPAGQSTATLVLHCMCLDEGLAATALSVARGWVRSPDPELSSTATAAFSGALGVCFPTDAVKALLHRTLGRFDDQAWEAMVALAGLVVLLMECEQDAGAVLRPLAYRLKDKGGKLTAHQKDRTLDAALTVVARHTRTGRMVCAVLPARDPRQADPISELWAGLLANRPYRRRVLLCLHLTLRDLSAATDEPEQTAERLGRSLGAALPPDERPRLGPSLRQVVGRFDKAAAPLIDIFLEAVLSTED
ncbi:nSTAND3 domain-containing NTPase [Streptomyces sp. NPDC001178]